MVNRAEATVMGDVFFFPIGLIVLIHGGGLDSDCLQRWARKRNL